MRLVSTNPKKGNDNNITLNGLILFYQKLVSEGRLKVGSAGHKRMTELQQKSIKLLRFKRLRYGANYGTQRFDIGTTE